MSCPYTSTQNGKAKHILRTTDNVIRSLHFRRTSLPPFGLWLSVLPHIYSRFCQPRLNFSTPHFAPFGSKPANPHMTIFRFLVANVIQTFLPQPSISLRLCFLSYSLTIRAIFALVATLIESSSCAMWSLMSPLSPSPRTPLPH